MFPRPTWIERHLADIGLWMFLAGIVSLPMGLGAQLWLNAGESAAPLAPMLLFLRFLGSALFEPLIYSGVALYLFGRIAGNWVVAIVGFEHQPTATLLVKGPDLAHTVWLGRCYATKAEAEAAAIAIAGRGARKAT